MDVHEAVDLQEMALDPIPEHIYKTSADVRRRVRALKTVQEEIIKQEANFFKEIHDLEVKYAAIYDEINKSRAAVVMGVYEPTEAEASKHPLLQSIESTDLQAFEEEWNKSNPSTGVAGVPDFWLNVFLQSHSIGDMITDADQPVLKHLVDVTYKATSEPQTFTLVFKFKPNEYFENTEITKTYTVSTAMCPQKPFTYTGPSVQSIQGTKIQWKAGKNVTKDEKGNDVASVFRFFEVFLQEEPDCDDEDAEMHVDFEIGQKIRDEIIPRAVLYYTGEATDEDGIDEDDFLDELSDDDEDDAVMEE
ncbi:hypothetical protein L596_017502 [Steinernema carpocapsae]|uniref:t-SNARE coiled-coil homology domain-containing protein n=1 Tax=Steinernema carpocapsae TaxID=34508 RepID=A0A4U5N2J9_STECR|nr:hypothetical protein L596_017502 [Steinernema carpocapsae]